MSAKLQRGPWAFPLFGAIAILAIAYFVPAFHPSRTNAPAVALAQPPSAAAWHSPIASQQVLPRPAKLPVIDPVLAYSTFLGGSNSSGQGLGAPPQQAYASFVDGPGNVYLTGPTNAPDFPVTAGTVQTTNPSGASVSFLAKLNPAGTSLVFSTYLNLLDAPVLAVDGSGNIFVGGTNPSFPMPSGGTPFKATSTTFNSILIVKLNSTATQVLAATYLGGSGGDFLTGLAVDAAGNLYAAGSTTSNDFPTRNAFQASLGSGGSSNFVAKLDPTLSTLLYASYLGQDSSDGHLAVDSSNNAYVVGQASSGFPVTSGAAQSSCSTDCATLAKLNPSASGAGSLLYATYLGGTADSTRPAAVAVDSAQNVYISGATDNGFTEVNSLQPCAPTNQNGLLDNQKGFVAKVSAAGALAFSSCLGDNTITDVVVDGSGVAYVTGTADATLPLVNPIQNTGNPPNAAQFVAAINASAGTLLFSSFVSGNGTFNSVGVDAAGNIIASGIGNGLNSTPFPVFNAFQPSTSAFLPAGCPRAVVCSASDALVVKILPTAGAAAALSPASLTFPAQQLGTPSAAQTVTITDMGSNALTVSNVAPTGDFSIQNGCTSVAAAGGTCAIQVTFTPTALGNRTGALTITDNSAGSPRTVQLSGVGGTGVAAVSPNSLSFGTQQPNTTSASQQVTLTNSGAVALPVSHIDITGPFVETNQCGSAVPAGLGCIITVTFKPTAAGAATGTLSVTDGLGNQTQSVALTGTGGTPNLGLGVGPFSSLSASVTAGQVATYELAIGGQGIGGSASLICTGAPAGTTCNVTPTATLSATTPSTVNVGVRTTARSQLFPFSFGPMLWLFALVILAGLIYLGTASLSPALRLPYPSLRLRWGLVPLFALALCACGGGNSAPTSGGTTTTSGTAAGTYTLVITAKSGATTQTLNLTLTVK